MKTLQPDNLGRWVLQTLYPNFKKTVEEIEHQIQRSLLKALTSISYHDIVRMYGLNSRSEVTQSLVADLGLRLLAGTTLDNLDQEVEERLKGVLECVVIEDQGVYQLSKYGVNLTRRCFHQSSKVVVDWKVKFTNLPYHSNFREIQVLAHRLPAQTLCIVHLVGSILKVNKMAYWNLMRDSLFVRGLLDSFGILQTVYYIRFTPPPKRVVEEFVVRSGTISGQKESYVVQHLSTKKQFLLAGELLEPEVPLKPDLWSYVDGEYTFVKTGITVELGNPVIAVDLIKSFETIRITHQPRQRLSSLVLDLLESFTHKTSGTTFLAFKAPNNVVILVSWEDVEEELGYEREEIQRLKIKYKQMGELGLPVRVEGVISRQEFRQVAGVEQTLYYLTELDLNPLFDLE